MLLVDDPCENTQGSSLAFFAAQGKKGLDEAVLFDPKRLHSTDVEGQAMYGV